MFDDVSAFDLVVTAGIAFTAASALALLRASTLRRLLIVVWALVPVWLVLWTLVMTAHDLGWDWSALGFGAVFVSFLLPPWLALTVFPFTVITRLREISATQ